MVLANLKRLHIKKNNKQTNKKNKKATKHSPVLHAIHNQILHLSSHRNKTNPSAFPTSKASSFPCKAEQQPIHSISANRAPFSLRGVRVCDTNLMPYLGRAQGRSLRKLEPPGSQSNSRAKLVIDINSRSDNTCQHSSLTQDGKLLLSYPRVSKPTRLLPKAGRYLS